MYEDKLQKIVVIVPWYKNSTVLMLLGLLVLAAGKLISNSASFYYIRLSNLVTFCRKNKKGKCNLI